MIHYRGNVSSCLLPGRRHTSPFVVVVQSCPSTHPPTHPPEKKTTNRLFFERKKTTFRCFPAVSRCFPLFSAPFPAVSRCFPSRARGKKFAVKRWCRRPNFVFFHPTGQQYNNNKITTGGNWGLTMCCLCPAAGCQTRRQTRRQTRGLTRVGRRTLFRTPLVSPPCRTLCPHRGPDPVLHWCHHTHREPDLSVSHTEHAVNGRLILYYGLLSSIARILWFYLPIHPSTTTTSCVSQVLRVLKEIRLLCNISRGISLSRQVNLCSCSSSAPAWREKHNKKREEAAVKVTRQLLEYKYLMGHKDFKYLYF